MSKLRLDRIASLYLFHPLSRTFFTRSGPRLPILMYHSIREGISARHPYYETNTSPRVFAEQMKFLHENGYQAIDLEAATRALDQGAKPDKSVVITFDDGYRDFYSHAYPILKENSLSATVFLITRWTSDERSRFNETECMTWSEVRELLANGIQFGSHTVTHPKLKLLNSADIDREIGQSKIAIEDRLGSPVTSFAYPYAFPETDRSFIRNLQDTLDRHGYKNGVSTIIGTAGTNDDRFFLPRLPVNSWDDLRFFGAKLRGGYDWLHAIQRGSKFFKSGMA